ncbi:MAG: GNAT family N-acetyltransferase [Cyanobacteria bacterium P01_E01_bin.45]
MRWCSDEIERRSQRSRKSSLDFQASQSDPTLLPNRMATTTERRPTVAQQKAAADTLGAAFARDPFMSYVLPDAPSRERKLAKLFLPTMRCGLRYGGVEVNPDGKAALTWLSGGDFPLRLSQVIRSGLIWTPLNIGFSATQRLEDHEDVCDRELLNRAPAGFAYLWIVGVHPEARGQGLGRLVIQSALNNMRTRGHTACLLRTDTEKNVSFYEHLGFQQIHSDTVPGSNLPYWLFSQDLV